MPKEIMGIKLYTTREVAELLGVSVVTAQKYLKRGDLVSRTIGGKKLISENELKRFLKGE